MTSSLAPRLFALVIGIDEYLDPYTPRLDGAVSDADRVAEYLTSRLLIPRSRIKNLRRSEATRSAIKKELLGLAENPSIGRDDPILIYFAGHGNDLEAPPEWKDWDSRVQSLLPYDYAQPDGEGGTIQGLADRSLGTILKKVADAKGNNITVILDCCHSASGTRGARLVRSSKSVGKPIPANLDADLFSTATRGFRVLPRFRHHGLQSHVLLAACTSTEEAYESNGHGVFTTALLDALYKIESIANTTYGELIRMLATLTSQNPQCEGNADRVMFSNNLKDMKSYFAAHLSSNGKLVIEAGRVHGISTQTTFSLYKTMEDVPAQTGIEDGSHKMVATAAGARITPFKTEISTWANPDIVGPIALIAKPQSMDKPTLNVHIPPEFNATFSFLFEPTTEVDAKSFTLKAATSKMSAHVGLSVLRDGTMAYELLDPDEQMVKQASRRLGTARELWATLSHIASYYHHLRHSNPKPPHHVTYSETGDEIRMPFMPMFNLEVYELAEDDEGRFHPVGRNLNVPNSGVRLVIPDIVDEDDEGPLFGFKITNSGPLDVYPHLFYFNSYDLSIGLCYKPVNIARPGQRAEPPLKQKNEITGDPSFLSIGWGAGGTQPKGYLVDPNTNIENGFLKLYITQEAADLSFLEQTTLARRPRGHNANAGKGRKKLPLWGCFTIPFILERQKTKLPGTTPSPEMSLCVLGSNNAKVSFMQNLFTSANTKSTRKTDNGLIETHEISFADGRPPLSILDLPSFDNDNLDKNTKITNALIDYFRKSPNVTFQAFIFAYDISKPWVRLQATDLLNLSLLRDLCGEAYFANITFLTTNWDRNYNNTFDKRAKDLEMNARLWKPFLQQGSQVKRHEVTPGFSLQVISTFANQKPRSLAIQQEVLRKTPVAKMDLAVTLTRRLESRAKVVRGDIDEVMREIAAASRSVRDANAQVKLKKMEVDKKEYENEKLKLERYVAMFDVRR